MEELQNLEQPVESDIENAIEQIEEEKVQNDNSNTGSEYGKFKDATSLLNAYNSLEKEFTKKSQKLSELLKSVDNVSANEMTQSQENGSLDYNENSLNNFVYKKQSWKTDVEKFFENNPEAKVYSKEIANQILNDKQLAKTDNCLEYAYAKVIKNNYRKPADLITDQKFLDENVFNNEDIKNKIINEYLNNLNLKHTTPRFITGQPNSISPTALPNKPQNLKEASQILKKLLQS